MLQRHTLTVMLLLLHVNPAFAQQDTSQPIADSKQSSIFSRQELIDLVGIEKCRTLEELSASKNGEPMTPDEVRAILGEEKFVEFSKVIDAWTRRQAENADSPQRQQHNQIVEALRSYTLDETVASLHRRGGIDELAFSMPTSAFANRNQLPPGQLTSVRCLGDRRFAKIYEHLKQLPREDAAKQCDIIFQEHWKALNDGLDVWFGLLSLPSETKREPIGRHDHALRCSLLFTAMFCDSQTLLNQIDRCKTANLLHRGRTIITAKHPNSALGFVANFSNPDQLFLAHAIMINLQQQGRLTPEILAEAHRLGLPEERVVSMIKWDAPYNIDDSSRLVPLDGDDPRLERSFKVTRYWGARAYNSLDIQDTVVAYLRGVLSQPAGGPQDPQPTPADQKK